MGPALVRGYATMSNDNGHRGSVWTFAQFPEKVVDFGHRAQHVTTVAGKAIVQAFYGTAAKHSYFYACSQGGHHALMEAQRYPEDYDGIIAGDPANDWTHLMFASCEASMAARSFWIRSSRIPGSSVCSLRTTHSRPRLRNAMRCDKSPMAIAFS